MTTYIVVSNTNYGVSIDVVNAESKSDAKEIALQAGAWVDCEVFEVDSKKQGHLFSIPPSGG